MSRLNRNPVLAYNQGKEAGYQNGVMDTVKSSAAVARLALANIFADAESDVPKGLPEKLESEYLRLMLCELPQPDGAERMAYYAGK